MREIKKLSLDQVHVMFEVEKNTHPDYLLFTYKSENGTYGAIDYRGSEPIVEEFPSKFLATAWLKNEDFDAIGLKYANIIVSGIVFDRELGFTNDGMASIQFFDAETDELMFELEFENIKFD